MDLKMTEIAAREAKNRFGRLLHAAQSSPVRVTRKGRAVGVVISIEHYERLRGVAWAQLGATMDRMRAAASANGLTDAKLHELLVDEN